MKRLTLTLVMAMMALAIHAQMMDPVHFTTELKTHDGSADAEIVFSATIDPGWHIYSTGLGQAGPVEASFNVVRMEGVETVGRLTPKGNEIKKFDEMFGMELKYFERAATFVQKVRFTKATYDLECYLEYGACNDQNCLPPTQVTLKRSGMSPAAGSGAKATPDGTAQPLAPDATHTRPAPADTAADTSADSIADSIVAPPADGNSLAQTDMWAPVVEELRAAGDGSDDIAGRSLLYLLLMGFVGGLLAVCMPCIWPIIPMTVSFFLKRAKADKRKGMRDAMAYGLSIIVIYLSLGLLVTAIFGSDTLNAMSTNAVFNIFLFVLLVVFALSFFGWFELTLPGSWADSVDTKATATGGLLSIFLMAFTLVLVSFSCTAPIIGLLLVETATSGNWLAPAVGMLGFAVALALPFTLFAIFPSWLKQAPKSGSWMTTLKVVLGFVELAFALKFLSVADLAYGWHLLDREVFLALWIAIFTLLGSYLCGWLKFQADIAEGQEAKPMPVLCIMGGLASLAFAIYMLPGLWGAPCKAVSAFAPPVSTQDFNLNDKTVEARFLDYDEAMAAARAEGKPVLLDFSGYGCVNCRKMEAAVWTDPRVADKLRRQFVLVSLFVDDKTPLPQPMEVTDAQGDRRSLTTVGAKWSYLQSHKFGANAQPFYVIIDPGTGRPLAPSRAYDEDIDAYINFLDSGLRRYRGRTHAPAAHR